MADQSLGFTLGGAFSEGWQVMKRHYGVLLGGSALVLIASVTLGLIPVVGPIVQILLSGPLVAGWLYLGVKAYRGPVEVHDVFLGFRNFGEALGIYWLLVLITVTTMIPAAIGIAVGSSMGMDRGGYASVTVGALISIALSCLVSLRLCFSWQISIDTGLGVIEPMRRSWRMTRSHLGALFGLGVCLVLVNIGLTTLLVVPFLLLGMPLCSAVAAVAFGRLVAEHPEAVKPGRKPNGYVLWRRLSQTVFLIALNPYFFMYRGFCIPAMNCWACPAAAFGCPVGAIGNFLVKGIVPFFAIGLMLLLGALVGRMICGWVCPFGLIQDLLARVPVKKLRFPKALAYGKYAFLVVTVFLIPIFFGIDKKPTGTHVSDFFFCNYCPAGTLEAAIPVRIFGSRLSGDGEEALAVAGEDGGADQGGGGMFDDPDEDLWGDDDDMGGGGEEMGGGGEEMGGGGEEMGAGGDEEGGDLWGDDDDDDAAGGDDWLSGGEGAGAADDAGLATAGASDTFRFMTSTRMWVLYVFILGFMFFRRPFCRGFCPIGAMFALLNRFSFFRMRVVADKCKGCNACGKKCPVDNKVYSSPGSDDCIRCLECMDNCKRGGVQCGLVPVKNREEYWE